jgi:2-methylisocitrate lyase-like PEP mutase family enzyme
MTAFTLSSVCGTLRCYCRRRKPAGGRRHCGLGSLGMSTDDKRTKFRQLHIKGSPLIMPNPADLGEARVLASLGFSALATTSGGFAATLGRSDYGVSRQEAIAHAAAIVASVDVPVSADLENGFGDRPDDVAATVNSAVDIGLAGCSIEDFTARSDQALYEIDAAAERVAAAAEAAHRGPGPGLVLTARAENYLRGHPDLADTIRRLQAFEEAGADVLYAPGLTDLSEISTIVSAVELPVNVLLMAGGPSVTELAHAGVARISVGSAFHYVALGALARAGRQLLEDGSCAWMDLAAEGRTAAVAAFK